MKMYLRMYVNNQKGCFKKQPFYNKISQKNTQSLAGYMNGFKILLY